MSQFELTPEQKDIQKAAREFAQGEFPQRAREADQTETCPRELYKLAADLGFQGLFFPEIYGGAGLGYLDFCLAVEEFWRVDPGLGQALGSVTFGADLLLLYGTEEQKKRYLPPLASGKAIMGAAITEPDAGSDITAVTTAALRDGDEWVLNGTKMFITNATLADYLVVFCLTNPHAPSRHERHSCLMVETDRPGYKATKLHGKLGIRASDTAEVVLQDVRVPAGNLIGTEGMGFFQFMEFFNRTRLHIGAQGVGVAQGALDKAVRHVKNREQFGKPLAAFQGVQFKIAEMATRVEAARAMVYRAAALVDAGTVDHRLIAMAKWFAGETGVRVTDEALQLHGGYGYLAENDIERFYRDAKIVELYEGTKEVEKQIVARTILGKV
ncbi:MAG: acyl-CoA dehydrogenase family protein [Thermodesulfobacteriota bacterium]|jgi:alkylation response protein AidB-like acyl-CoA dehydrogenase